MNIASFLLFALCFDILFLTSTFAKDFGTIACTYYDKTDLYPNRPLKRPVLTWTWARDAQGKRIHVEGKVVDGFFVTTKVYSKKKNARLSQIVVHPNHMKSLEQFCSETLNLSGNKDQRLLEIGCRGSLLGPKHLPILFEENIDQDRIDSVVIFGDSLSDSGNLKRRIKALPAYPYFAGRFSNGPIWVDYLGQATRLAIQNWAVGGSVANKFTDFRYHEHEVLKKILTKAQNKIFGSLKKQIRNYKAASLSNGNIHRSQSTLFVIWIGGNDYLKPLFNPHDGKIFVNDPNDPRIGSTTVVNRTIDNIMINLEELYDLGARKIAVVNLANLGTTPLVLKLTNFVSGHAEKRNEKIVLLSEILTNIAKLHNNKLKDALDKFQLSHQDVVLGQIDNFVNMKDIFETKLKDVSSLIKDFSNNKDTVRIFTAKGQSVAIGKTCKENSIIQTKNNITHYHEPKTRLFWDNVHPTTNAHRLLAYFFHMDIARIFSKEDPSVDVYSSL